LRHPFDHTVLIVEDDLTIGKAMARVLKEIQMTSDYAPDAKAGLLKIEAAQKPFSLIISDQRMPGMKGHEFLEAVSRISPETLRYLMSGYTDMEEIIKAVNAGAINRFIAKPWDHDELIQTIQNDIEDNEQALENKHLFNLAKTQNEKLYELNTNLEKETDEHEKCLNALNNEIEEISKEIDDLENTDLLHEKALQYIELCLKEKKMLNQNAFEAFVAHTKNELFEQFQDIAARNGFKMPERIE
jgi:DNA-binding NtrC family response regulator